VLQPLVPAGGTDGIRANGIGRLLLSSPSLFFAGATAAQLTLARLSSRGNGAHEIKARGLRLVTRFLQVTRSQ